MKILVFILGILLFFKVQAQNPKEEVAQLFVLLQNQKLSLEQTDNTYYRIRDLVKNKVSKQSDIDMKDLLKLSVMYFEHFHSDDTYEFIFNLYKFNRSEFQKAFHKLTPKEKKQIDLFLKYSLEAEKKGVG